MTRSEKIQLNALIGNAIARRNFKADLLEMEYQQNSQNYWFDWETHFYWPDWDYWKDEINWG